MKQDVLRNIILKDNTIKSARMEKKTTQLKSKPTNEPNYTAYNYPNHNV